MYIKIYIYIYMQRFATDSGWKYKVASPEFTLTWDIFMCSIHGRTGFCFTVGISEVLHAWVWEIYLGVDPISAQSSLNAKTNILRDPSMIYIKMWSQYDIYLYLYIKICQVNSWAWFFQVLPGPKHHSNFDLKLTDLELFKKHALPLGDLWPEACDAPCKIRSIIPPFYGCERFLPIDLFRIWNLSCEKIGGFHGWKFTLLFGVPVQAQLLEVVKYLARCKYTVIPCNWDTWDQLCFLYAFRFPPIKR